MTSPIHAVKNFYTRYERLISSLSLVGGFVFDIFTLKRVDFAFENIWTGAHLAVAALGIILLNVYENKKARLSPKSASIIHFWLIIVIQFAFGGLLSTFLVYYFRSATLVTGWPFLLMLALVFVGNEVLKHHYSRLVFQTSVLFICIYSFAIFIVPVLVHRIGADVFVASGLASLAVIGFFMVLLRFIANERFQQSKDGLFLSIIGLFVLINSLYFSHLIPPIPLSLKDSGIYHAITRDPQGAYLAGAEPQDQINDSVWSWWFNFFRFYQPVHATSNESLYAYTAIFSPTSLNTEVIHRWQNWDSASGQWITTNTIHLAIVGGRDEGYRTYSMKSSLPPGRWRVSVETPSGEVIGRILFEVSPVAVPILTVNKVL